MHHHAMAHLVACAPPLLRCTVGFPRPRLPRFGATAATAHLLKSTPAASHDHLTCNDLICMQSFLLIIMSVCCRDAVSRMQRISQCCVQQGARRTFGDIPPE